jgi:ABC-type uncharacterized transport system substrate-binding protein
MRDLANMAILNISEWGNNTSNKDSLKVGIVHAWKFVQHPRLTRVEGFEEALEKLLGPDVSINVQTKMLVREILALYRRRTSRKHRILVFLRLRDF